MGRMVTYEVQEVLRNWLPSPGTWNVISSIYAALPVSVG